MLGASISYRLKCSDFDDSRKDWFRDLFLKNTEYDKDCDDCEEWQSYRIQALNKAQAAFFLVLVWSQCGNGLIRKTQFASIFD